MTHLFKNVKLTVVEGKEVKKVVFDYRKLKGRIVEKYGSQTRFVKEYGISENSFSMKMNNKTRFSSDDIVKMSEMLDIPKEKVGEYFFTEKV